MIHFLFRRENQRGILTQSGGKKWKHTWVTRQSYAGCFALLIAGMVVVCAVNHSLYQLLPFQRISSQATDSTEMEKWATPNIGSSINHVWPLSRLAIGMASADKINHPRNAPCTSKAGKGQHSPLSQALIQPGHLDSGALPSSAAQNTGNIEHFSGFEEQQGAQMRHFPLTRAHCQTVLESNSSKDWSAALERCMTDRRCGLVTRNRRTGATRYCKDGTFKGLDYNWDTAVAEPILGVVSEGMNGGPLRDTILPWIGKCQQCKDGLYKVSTNYGCMCTECLRGQCSLLGLPPQGGPTKHQFLPASEPLNLPMSKKFNFSHQACFFNPSASIMYEMFVIAYRLSDDSKCKGLSYAGNFISDPLPYEGSKATFSSRVQVCSYHPINFPTAPKRCRFVEVLTPSIRNGKGLNFSEEVSRDLEDPRTFVANKQLYIVANIGVTGEYEGRRMLLVQLDWELRILDATLLWRSWNTSGAPRTEKNWSPLVSGRDIYMVYSVCPFVVCVVSIASGECELKITRPCPEDLLPSSSIHFKGSSQWIEISNGYLGVVHSSFQGVFGRVYAHRFVSVTPGPELRIRRVSDAFSLPAPETKIASTFQYVSGLAAVGGYAYLFYGIADCKSAVLEVPLASVFAKWLHGSIQIEAAIWWHASCNKYGSRFCAGQYQLPQLKAAFEQKAAVQLYVPNVESLEESRKYMPEDSFSAGPVQSYQSSDVIVLHGLVNSLPVANNKIVVAFSWPFHAIPKYMVQMAHSAIEVWVESRDEAAVLMQKGIAEHKIKLVPLTVLGTMKCSGKKNTLELANLRRRYPLLLEDWDLQLVYIGSTATIDGLAPLLRSYCTTFTGQDKILLVLLLSVENISRMQTCTGHHDGSSGTQPDLRPPATLIVAESEWQLSLSTWVNQADMVVYPSLLFSYSLAVLQALSCSKPLVVLWSQRATSYLPDGSAHFVRSKPLQVKAEAILPKKHTLTDFIRAKLLDQEELSNLQFVTASRDFCETLREIFERVKNKSSHSSLNTFTLDPAQDAAFQILMERLDHLLVTDPFVLRY